MITAEQELGLIRPKLVTSVARLRRDGLSTMDAYDHLARQIGRSATWIRKVIGRQPDATIRLRDAINVQAAYDRLCARIEAAAEAVEAENLSLREDLHAALTSAGAAPSRQTATRVAPPAPSGSEPGPEAPAALVRPAVGAHRGPRPRPGQAAELTDLPLWRAAGGE